MDEDTTLSVFTITLVERSPPFFLAMCTSLKYCDEDKDHLFVEAESNWLVSQCHEEISSVHLVLQMGHNHIN